MIKVKDVLNLLCELYPPDTACDFDNVGLLAGNGEDEVSGAVVALDSDINAIEFAKQKGANLIITHHPVIFEPLKSVTENDTVFKLIKDGISVISMHTNLDVAKGGVNDALLAAVGCSYAAELDPETGIGRIGVREAPAELSAFMAEMMPSPPALDTAAASFASETQAMPPWKIGQRMPMVSQILERSISP